MNVEHLLNELEGLVHHLPHSVQGPLDEVIETVRHIYETTVIAITPHETVYDGKSSLASHHQKLQELHTQLSNNTNAFQLVYQGEAANAYYAVANTSLGHLNTTLDHISFASQQHDTMGSQFGDARTSQLLLITMLGLVLLTLASIPATAGLDSEVAVPLAVGEVAGAGGIIAAVVTALEAAGAAIAALEVDALTIGVLATGAIAVSLSGDSAQATHSAATAIPLNWGGDAVLNPWRGDIESKLKAKGLTEAQIAVALASAAAIVKALECHGYSQQEINAIMDQFADLYDVSVKTPSKSSFWYTLAIYVKQAFGFSLFPKLSLPNKIDPASVLGYQRVLRALIAPDGYDGNNTPVSPARVSGGPLNVAQYGSKVYGDATGTQSLTQVEYDGLPADQKGLWKPIDGDVDIVTRDVPPKHIDVGGANKAEFVVLERQINRLKKLPGGASTAYYFLEAPAADSPASTQANFETALRNARALLDPSHVIVISAPTSVCTPPGK